MLGDLLGRRLDGGGLTGLFAGHEGIHDYFARAGEDTPLVFHHTGSPDIQIDGDRAHGTWHVMVRAYSAYAGVDLTGTWE